MIAARMEPPLPGAGRRWEWLLAAVGALVAGGFLAAMLHSTGARFVPQVVDLYLVCNYARAMAEGRPFQYNPGDPPSTGATSLLHTGLLAAAHRAGFRGEGLVAFAILTGAALYAGTIWMAYDIGRRLAGRREALLAGALVALGGPVVWGFLYGADVALFLFAATWLLRSLVVAWPQGRFAPVVAPAVVVALTRPEGLALALILAAAWRLAPGRSARAATEALPLVPVGAGLLVLLNNRAMTGTWVGSSIADKSLFANFGVPGALGVVADYGVDVVRGLLLGFYPSTVPIGFSRGFASLYFPPLGLLLVGAAALRAHPATAPVRVWLAAAAVVFALVSPNMFLGVHFNRYILWAFPGLLALAAVGTGAAARASGPARDRGVFGALAGLLLVLGALSTLRFGVIYGDMAGEVARRDLALARYIVQSLPPGVAMANVATSVEYLTGHRSLNLHGVTSAAFFGTRTGEREAGIAEGLSRLPAAERPEYLVTSAAAQEGSELLREVVSGPPLFRTTSLGDELEVHRLRYDALDAAAAVHLPETLQQTSGLREVDRLNVCDPVDEAAHAYDFASHLGDLRLDGAARVEAYGAGGPRVVDGGRAIVGWEGFSVATSPGRDLVVVLRTAETVPVSVSRASGSRSEVLHFAEAEMAVTVDGRPLARLRRRSRAGWDEAVVRIPGSAVTRARTRLELRGAYAAYRYWFFQ
jgi:hypothetical protein